MKKAFDKSQEVLAFTTVANLYSVGGVFRKGSLHFNAKGIIHAYAKTFLIIVLFYNNTPNEPDNCI